MKETTKETSGTSFFGTTIEATINQLYDVLGKPEFLGTVEDKSQYDWVMENDLGEVFTVYDWKEYRYLDRDEMIEWHIGGFNGSSTDRAKDEIQAALNVSVLHSQA